MLKDRLHDSLLHHIVEEDLKVARYPKGKRPSNPPFTAKFACR